MHKKWIVIIIIIIISCIGVYFLTHQAEINNGKIVKVHIKEISENGDVEEYSLLNFNYTISGNLNGVSTVEILCFDKYENNIKNITVDHIGIGKFSVELPKNVCSVMAFIKYEDGTMSNKITTSGIEHINDTLDLGNFSNHDNGDSDHSKPYTKAQCKNFALSRNPGMQFVDDGEDYGDYYEFTFISHVPYADNHIRVNKYTGEVT